MNETKETPTRPASHAPQPRPEKFFGLPPKLIVAWLLLIACFAAPLYRLVRFALQSDLYSYILLVPFVSGYLFNLNRRETDPQPRGPVRGWTIFLLVTGVATLGYLALAQMQGGAIGEQDLLALTTLSFVALFAGAFALLGPPALFRRTGFPLAFLGFMIPFPVVMEHAIETFLQRGSAPPAYWLFKLAGTPVFRHDMVFQLPGITLQIAPECSGIRSSLVLFMTSLLAGHLFLRSPWKKTLLAVFVIPLALVRNGFRVFTIGQLCVHIGPHMIDSAIHHKGGPIFFALSLIPFFALVYYLVRSDRTRRRPAAQLSAAQNA